VRVSLGERKNDSLMTLLEMQSYTFAKGVFSRRETGEMVSLYAAHLYVIEEELKICKLKPIQIA
jgi:hypothetical protein